MNTTLQDRAAGVLIGQAAGDALGAPYEYRRPPSLGEARMAAGGLANWELGEWTDDTQQAILVARGRSSWLQVGELLIKWYQGNPPDVGTTTRRAMHGARNAQELLAQAEGVQGKSNGSLMRTGPVALTAIGDRTTVAQRAEQVSVLTHAHHDAIEACVIWSLLVEQAVREGGPLTTEWLTEALNFIHEYRRPVWESHIRQVISYPGDAYRDNGTAVGAFRAALAAILHTPRQELEGVLQRAVSYGGDTDTVAAIAGSLAGAMHGASAVPAEWLKVLHGIALPGEVLDAAALKELALSVLPEGVRV